MLSHALDADAILILSRIPTLNTITSLLILTSIPTTLPKNILFSEPQLGQGPLATKGSLKKKFSVTCFDIDAIGTEPTIRDSFRVRIGVRSRVRIELR